MTIVRNFAILAANVSSSGVISGYNGGTITGELKMWPTATAPVGYLLCNGALVSRTTYADLFSVIGTTYGAGDNTSTFGLPNFNDKMPIGAGLTYSANTTGGSANSVVVSHTHTISGSTGAMNSNASHSHTQNPVVGAGITYIGAGSTGTGSGSTGTTNIDHTHDAGSLVNSTVGSSGTNANLPPYIGIHFIIRTGL
jgi:microcystin-dependent protein